MSRFFTISVCFTALCFISGTVVIAQDEPIAASSELDVLKSYVGTWDAEIEVWAQGLDSDPIKFKGVEVNRPYGKYWLASDFDSEFMGQKVNVHSIVGFDRDKQKMAGTVIDSGIYPASMTGDYDAATKTVTWMTTAKDAQGNTVIQKTVVTQKSADVRVLVLKVPGKKEGEFNKFMQIEFVRRKPADSN